ncbi:MAG TPA: iron-containing alcohol dehydrogenase [Ignavibacteriales bacterium]|nr:iron-containing alcohol dehydrogenase [Ignavibacteriales bacterium]HOL81811.1 iron-containing alcohol dehydrogenase [Ignavibacteriales bacterium]HOM65814.1 iron-containing alcohol dehydrogenase [Ignavibacteriales bacterium]HPD67083.1 iron-containing alcohol dehydrogenase [Ignavibacteriales bacterium]HPP33948.1 iron-containing alcohol dehydrogenase [Ignavibacteriales bacterium]
MLNFNLHINTKILFGKDKIIELPAEITKWGSRVLFVYGGNSIKKIGLYDKVTQILRDNCDFYIELSGVQPNPKITSVREGVKLIRENKLDFILAVGGGSVIDCAKAISAGANYDGDPWDFPMRKAKVVNPLPLGVVLTFAATGSEMNGGSVITNEELKMKRPFGDEQLRPKFAILDPTYTYSLNKYQTACGAVDMFSHLLETYFAPTEGAGVQDRIAEGLMKNIIHYSKIALNEPENYEARANLMWTSSLAINGLTGAGKMGDWATHMIEHEVSAINDMAHGAGLALIFPYWMQYVLSDETLWKFIEYANNVWGIHGNDLNTAQLAINKTREYFYSLGMPSHLKDVDITEDMFEEMAEKAVIFGPIGQLKKLQKEDIINILKLAY